MQVQISFQAKIRLGFRVYGLWNQLLGMRGLTRLWHRANPIASIKLLPSQQSLTAVPTLIPITLLGWIPVSIALFLLLPSRRAVAASIIGAWLLLPPASIPLSGLPDYDKMMAATVGILLGTLIFQPNRLLEFRPQWFDLPMLCWCIAPLISSLQNGLGLYDGLSGSFSASFAGHCLT